MSARPNIHWPAVLDLVGGFIEDIHRPVSEAVAIAHQNGDKELLDRWLAVLGAFHDLHGSFDDVAEVIHRRSASPAGLAKDESEEAIQ